MLKLIYNLKLALITLEKTVAASSLLLLLIFTLTQIIARNFFDFGFPHLETISRHLVLFIAFSGAAMACENNSHIKIDVLSSFLSPKQKDFLIKPLLIISGLVCVLFARYATQFWLDELDYAPLNELWIVYMALILPLGFTVLSLHFFLLSLSNEQKSRPES